MCKKKIIFCQNIIAWQLANSGTTKNNWQLYHDTKNPLQSLISGAFSIACSVPMLYMFFFVPLLKFLILADTVNTMNNDQK